ncbi:MAG: alpha/beta hydrolase [Clostridia bacterium]|nr:alpha/beta hydrolase [Clostridia bacterium]
MKKAIKTAAGIAGITAASYMTVGEVFYNLFLTRGGISFAQKFQTKSSDGDEQNEIFSTNEAVKEGDKWYAENEKTRIEVYTRDGSKRHAYMIKTKEPSHKYVITCHGYTSKPSDMGFYGMEFQKRGYNVIMPALDGHADSETNKISMGWHDRLIVVALTYYIAEQDPQAQIVLHGNSMGGATVMMTTGEKMPENVKCCIEDCGYTSVWDEYKVQLKAMFGIDKLPVLQAANTAAKIHAKLDFKEASSLNQVKKSVTPTLFIHGERDTFVPFWMLETNYSAAVCEKDKLVVPDAVHGVSSLVHPELYWSKIDEFTAKYITE